MSSGVTIHEEALDQYAGALVQVRVEAACRHASHPRGRICRGCAWVEHKYDVAWLDALHEVSTTWVPGTPDRTRVL